MSALSKAQPSREYYASFMEPAPAVDGTWFWVIYLYARDLDDSRRWHMSRSFGLAQSDSNDVELEKDAIDTALSAVGYVRSDRLERTERGWVAWIDPAPVSITPELVLFGVNEQ